MHAASLIVAARNLLPRGMDGAALGAGMDGGGARQGSAHGRRRYGLGRPRMGWRVKPSRFFFSQATKAGYRVWHFGDLVDEAATVGVALASFGPIATSPDLASFFLLK